MPTPDDILVQCRNKLCDWFGNPCTIPASLGVAVGEQIICGGCGHETRFIGANRPTVVIPFSDNMNRAIPLKGFEEG